MHSGSGEQREHEARHVATDAEVLPVAAVLRRDVRADVRHRVQRDQREDDSGHGDQHGRERQQPVVDVGGREGKDRSRREERPTEPTQVLRRKRRERGAREVTMRLRQRGVDRQRTEPSVGGEREQAEKDADHGKRQSGPVVHDGPDERSWIGDRDARVDSDDARASEDREADDVGVHAKRVVYAAAEVDDVGVRHVGQHRASDADDSCRVAEQAKPGHDRGTAGEDRGGDKRPCEPVQEGDSYGRQVGGCVGCSAHSAELSATTRAGQRVVPVHDGLRTDDDEQSGAERRYAGPGEVWHDQRPEGDHREDQQTDEQEDDDSRADHGVPERDTEVGESAFLGADHQR